MGNCNCGSGSDTAILTTETDVATKDSSCCGPESTSKAGDEACCSDSDACSIERGPNSNTTETQTVGAGKSSCC
jgi:hypothetical protein